MTETEKRLVNELNAAFLESVRLHGIWMQAQQDDAARKAWMRAHGRYMKALDALRAENPVMADLWTPPRAQTDN